jgi:hypothetical protein
MKNKKIQIKPHTPRQIVDMIKKETKPRIWSKDLRDWYVAEIIDLVLYNRLKEREAINQLKNLN